jgi:hypothetical protein
MPTWVRFLRPWRLSLRGVPAEYGPGDWAKVGNGYARQLVHDGVADSPLADLKRVEEPKGSVGIMLFGTDHANGFAVDTSLDARYELRWEKTAFFDVSAPVDQALLPAGFKFLDVWSLAVPMLDYRRLVEDEPMPEAERERVRGIIHDLRVPLYDTRLILAKRCPEVQQVLDLWEAEGRSAVGFLLAVYQVVPYILPLPVTWTGQWAPTRS